MKFRLNSLKILNKWKVKKYLFRSQNKLFVEVYDPNFKNSETTLIIMNYDEEIQQPLQKLIQRIHQKTKENTYTKLIVPENISTDNIGESKMFVMQFVEKPLSVYTLMRKQNYKFSPKEIFQAAISGVKILLYIFPVWIMHCRINTKTCYFYNRTQKAAYRRTYKAELVTVFGLSLVDIAKFYPKSSLTSQDKCEEVLFEPVSEALNIKHSYKSDLESLLYVLIKMGTGQQIFSQFRYQKQWITQQNVRKWKINDLYAQMIQKLSQKLFFLVEFYLYISEFDSQQKPDYDFVLKKLWKWKQNLIIKQADITQSNTNMKHSQLLLQMNDSKLQIFQEDINLDVRFETTGFDKLK